MASLYEHKQGKVSHTTKHKFLYHLTNHHGYAYTIDQNALRPLRQSTISTTYDPNNNSIFGYMHYDFKFVMNGRALVERYGGFSYDHFIRVGDEGMQSLDERELRLNTNEVSPFNEYLIGTVLLFKVFSQKSVQWLLYDNKSRGGMFDSKTSPAPRAIEALYRQMFELKKPVWVGRQRRLLTNQEMAFLADAYHLSERGGDFAEGMRELSFKYPVKDHWDKDLDRTMVIRRQMASEIVSRYNGYFAGRKRKDVEPKEVKKLLRDSIRMLGLGSNAEAVLLHHAEACNLFHPYIAAVDWGVVMRELFDGDIEEAMEGMTWLHNDRQRNIEWYDSNPEFHGEAYHVGTRFG